MASFKVPSVAEERLLRLVAAYSGSEGVTIAVDDSLKEVEFAGPGGEQAFGSNTAARHVAGLSPLAKQLLGEGQDQQAKVGAGEGWRRGGMPPPVAWHCTAALPPLPLRPRLARCPARLPSGWPSATLSWARNCWMTSWRC